ncbi:spore germination protein [Rhodococcus sp. LBL1]|nr:spore germination protein [Rhodococcus sp. LBL1]MDH6684195.1 spore germination protein [Rhodococcus sp. LBL2]
MTGHLTRRDGPRTCTNAALAATAALSRVSADAWVADRTDLPLVIGAIPYLDRGAALMSMYTHARHIDVVSPWSYSVVADGTVTTTEGTRLHADSLLTRRLGRRNIRTIPTVTDTTSRGCGPHTVARVLSDRCLRRAHVDSLTGLVRAHRFDGVQIDYENVESADRSCFEAFVGELGAALHRIGRDLYVAVHANPDGSGYGPRNGSTDYTAIADSADKVIVMAYDRHRATSTAGPTAPYDWVEEVVRHAITRIPRDKLVLGVGLYGYDWVGSTAVRLTWTQAMSLAATRKCLLDWDEISRSPHFGYILDGVAHEVWFEDARSVAAKTELARRHGLAGIALWRLGGEDPSIWRLGP